ncbi:MAG: Acetyl-coenzyme A carboxylase carboxyl transferase subunit alpha [Chlamydiae bacterium]|nr:Acetyl-coenzyme A carboxylase carboxyl transferase subunit alpha [Chlamydiota bacterium]
MNTLPHEKEIKEYVKTIDHLRKKSENNPIFAGEIQRLERKLESLRKDIYSNLTPWQRVQICRHRNRPHSIDYIQHMFSDFEELSGDRLFANDQAIVGGFAQLGDMKCLVIGQECGRDTDDRIKRNFGMMQPEGYRKALRLMKLAEKFHLPVISLIDTKGAFPGLEAEQRGQGWAIAHNLREMSRIETPIICVVIGEGCSGGALGIGVGDSIGMLEHAYYSVISPEGCASILWKDASKNVEAAAALKLNSENLLEFDIIDEVLSEPLGGAHHHPQTVYQNVRQFVEGQWDILKRLPPHILLEQRYNKYRKIGQLTTQSHFTSSPL